MYLTRQPSEMSHFFCHYVFKFIHIKLHKPPLLGDGDLLVARELEQGLEEGLSHLPLVLQLGEGGHYDLALVDPGHYALALSRGIAHTCLEPVRCDQLQRGQRLVDAGDGEGVELHADNESHLCHSFSPGTCWHKYEQPPGLEWELTHFGLLLPQVKDVDHSIRDTSGEVKLWVQLVLMIPILITPCWVVAHGDTMIFNGESRICWEALRFAGVHWELNTQEFLLAMGNV